MSQRRAIFALLVLLFTSSGAFAQRERLDVWIDTDPSIGLAFHDADDGFALVQAFRSRELYIRGISVSYGNTTLAKAVDICREITKLCGARAGLSERDVFAGAASAADLGRPTEATAALAMELAQGKKLTYLALGPLTNLATFLKCHPELEGRIERVIFLGGRQPGEHFKLGARNSYEFHDANFEKDIPAAAAVLDSSLPLTLTPAMLSKSVLLTTTDLERIGREGGISGRYLHNKAEPWLRLWQIIFGLEGGPVFDSMTILAASHPEQMTFCPAHAGISSQIDRFQLVPEGLSTAKRFLLAVPNAQTPKTDQTTAGRPVTLCSTAKPGTKRLLVDQLSDARTGKIRVSSGKAAAN